MSDVQWLFLALALLYAWECACWIRRGSVAFTTWLGLDWRAQHPGTLVGNQRGGFILAPPLPPLGTVLTASTLPLSVSPDGVLAYVATNVNPGWRPPQNGRFIRFADVRNVRAQGRKVFVHGKVFLAAHSTGLANHLAAELARVAKLEPPQRESALLEWTRAMFDLKAIERRRRELSSHSRPLRLLTNALFVYLFVAAPVVIWHLGFKLSWLGLLLGLLALTIATAAMFQRAHRALFPRAGDERFTHVLTIALSPPTAMRALDALSRHLLEMFHPLAVGMALMPKRQAAEFARRVLLDLKHPARPICPGEDPRVHATERHAREVLRTVSEEMLRQSGLDPDNLCRAPAPADATCRTYCPRCDAQFTVENGACADCGGLALLTFGQARSEPPSPLGEQP